MCVHAWTVARGARAKCYLWLRRFAPHVLEQSLVVLVSVGRRSTPIAANGLLSALPTLPVLVLPAQVTGMSASRSHVNDYPFF